jgi:hypothetical protein
MEAKTEEGSWKSVNDSYYAYGILLFDFFEHRIRRIVEYGFSMLLSFNNVIIIIMNTYFPEPSSVLVSMFFHF